MTSWDHPQSAWICETAEILAGFGVPASEGTRRLLWAAAGLPRGRLAGSRSRVGKRDRERAEEVNAEAVAAVHEACVAASRLADEEGVEQESRARAADLLADAESRLRAALDLPE